MANGGKVVINIDGDTSGFKTAMNSVGTISKKGADLAVGAIKGIATATVGATTGLIALSETTREYRENINKLESQFISWNSNAQIATDTYRDFYSLLGDTDTATEATQLIANMTTNTEDLAIWSDIAAGSLSSYGDALPIEGLIESANETANVGKVTGSLADALNWAGESEDAFNVKLANLTSTQERAALIQDTLNGLYGDAGQYYKEMNADIIESRLSQEKLNSVLADFGGAVEPLVTEGKGLLADFLQPFADEMQGLESLSDLPEMLVSVLSQLTTKIVELLPMLLDVAISIVGGIAEQLLASIPTLLPTLLDATVLIISTIGEQLVANAPMFLQSVIDLILTLAQFLTDNAGGMVDGAIAIIQALVDTMIDNLDLIIEAAIDLILALVLGLTQGIPKIAAMIPDIIVAIVKALITNLPDIISAGIDIILALQKGFYDAFPEFVAAVPELVFAIIEAIFETNWLQVGVDIVKGILSGFLNVGGLIYDTVASFGSAILDGITSFFGISSPAKRTMPMGEDVGLGVGVGVSNSTKAVLKEVDKQGEAIQSAYSKMSVGDMALKMSSGIVNTVNSGVGGVVPLNASGNSHTSNSNVINVYVTGGTSAEQLDARAISKAIGEETQKEMRARGVVHA